MATKKPNAQSEDSKKDAKAVTLKRTVAIKAIVTEKFKDYMNFELQATILNTEDRIAAINTKLKELTQRLSEPNSSKQILTYFQQLEAEKFQLQASLEELKGREQKIQELALGSEFMQGMIDGFVQVKVGDNLYEKLGGLEITVKDGLVQNIANISQAAAGAQLNVN